MKKAKLVNIAKKENVKKESYSYSLKNFILIILILLVILGVFYILTTLLVKPVKQNNTDNSVTKIDHTKITLNNLLNRSADQYYVLAIKESLYKGANSNINYTQLYNNYINEYSSLENSLPFYKVDLDDALNKNYIGDKLKVSNEISKIKLNDEVLFKIKDGEIDEYFVGNSEILEELSSLKESN